MQQSGEEAQGSACGVGNNALKEDIDMKDKLDMIFSRDEKDIEHISEKYPAAGKKEKKKIYEISRRRYDELRAEDAGDDGYIKEAEGVERYNRPVWYRGMCAAAAAVILMGGVGGGIMLSRSSRIQHMNASSDINAAATTSATITNAADSDRNAVVDRLMSNAEMITKPQYPETDSIDRNDEIYFNMDEFSFTAGRVVNLTKYYYAVADERLDTMEELTAVLNETFIYETRSRYIGGDLSNHEVGYDFRDDSLANRYVRNFITYNGKVYALSCCEGDMNYVDSFDNRYNFSSYKLISSEFQEGDDMYSSYMFSDEDGQPIPSSDIIICKRVYERPDGAKVTSRIKITQEKGEWKIASFGSNTEDDETFAISDGLTVSSEEPADNGGEFAELQLHEQNICSDRDEALALYAKIAQTADEGGYTFKKVDTGKYAQQIIEASSFDELNTLENKSFVYHMFMNSYRYFDTADVSYTYDVESNESPYYSKNRCIADNKGKYFYLDYEYEKGSDHEMTTFYMYNNKWINADNMKKVYSECEADEVDYEHRYIPDNDLFIRYYDENGNILYMDSLSTVVMGGKCSDCLYHDTDVLYDFEKWHIEDVENILGRECVSVTMQDGAYSEHMCIDLYTGIVMSLTRTFADTNEIHTMKVASIKTGQPIDYIYFNADGYVNETNNS